MFNKNTINCTLIFPLALLLGWASIGWIDPLADKVREGNLLYNNGKYDEALDKYVNAQINSSNMPQLDFNIADTQYKRGKYIEAAQTFEKVIRYDDAIMKANSSYNLGNAMYRQGKMKEALECYKKTIDFIDEAGPRDGSELNMLKNDAKFNYEYVDKKMKEQEQKQQNQEQKDQQQKEEPEKDDNQSDEKQGEDKEKQEQQDKKQPEPEDTQEKNENKKDAHGNQSEKDNQKEQPFEQQMPQPQDQKQMSKEEAERLLNALNHSEKEARARIRDTQRPRYRSLEKDW